MHGYLSSNKSFCNQIPFFSNYFNVFAPDLTGFGENSYMPYPFSLDDYVEEVANFIKAHSLKTPCVVAHSFGARIVLKGLYDKRLNFEKVVLVGGAGLKSRFSLRKKAKKVVFNTLKLFVKREKLKRFYSPEYLSLNQTMRKSFSKIVSNTLDYTLPFIDKPVLLIYGDKDRETPLYMAKKLKKNLVNAQLSIYKNAGHFCFVSEANKFNLEVREFLLS